MTPQPMVYLLGPIWNKDYAQVSVSLHGSPSATALPTNNANHASKRLRLDSQPVSVPSPNLQSQWAETIGSESGPIALLSQTSHLSDSNASRTETPTTYVKSLFKSLFVNDTEKARGVVLRVSVGLTLPGAQVKVDVESKEVRIISKPSKKKVAAKTMECTFFGNVFGGQILEVVPFSRV